MRIFVVYGSNPYNFKRLTDAVLSLAYNNPEWTFVVQHGYSIFSSHPQNIKLHDFLRNSDFIENIKNSEAILGHCGFGLVKTCIKYCKPCFVLPREKMLGESIDEQSEVFEYFNGNGLLPIVVADLNNISNFPFYRPSEPKEQIDISPNNKILCISSGGGHGDQIVEILAPYNLICDIAYYSPVGRNIFGREVIISDPHRSIYSYLKLLVVAASSVYKERPDIIISTGAGLCIPFFLFGYVRGCKRIYIESFSRRTKPSLTLKILTVMPFLVNKIYVQSKMLVAKNIEYKNFTL